MRSVVDMGLKSICYSYYPSFTYYNNDNNKYEEFDLTVECLKIVKRDLERFINYISDLDLKYKDQLINYLMNVKDSILLDVTKYMENNLDLPEDNLNIKINNDYIILSIYDKFSLNYEKIIKPNIAIMSRSLKHLEFYFIEKVEQESPYIDSYYVINFKVNKNKIEIFSTYISDYDFNYETFKNTNECILELKKRLR